MPEKVALAGEHLAAIVTKVDDDCVCLMAFMPCHNGTHFAANVRYSEEKEPGTWHWIEREE